ncbi:hypothetical protein GGR56DRAFT_672458 [Xylariaceae sp. FL0804]|nr:hypothetical protein GGR56DRAFT_672458 [Xylariaceae sp. FL0804]
MTSTSAAPGPTAALGALGGNYNGNLDWLSFAELDQVQARWVRGFVSVHNFNARAPEKGPHISALLRAADAGYHVILSLQWDYRDSSAGFPQAGSPAHNEELRRLNILLRLFMGRVDVIVIGNEPDYETPGGPVGNGGQGPDERFSVFYEEMAAAVIDFRRRSSSSAGAEAEQQWRKHTALYMGAFVNLDQPAYHTRAASRMLAFIAATPELAGPDLHAHMPTLERHRAMLDWVLPRLRPDQSFLVTEFSLVSRWKGHMRDVVAAPYRARHGLAPDARVWQVLDGAIATPVPAPQWRAFLRGEPWYARNATTFLADALRLYRGTGRLHVATYALSPMRMRRHPFGEDDVPWLLNGLYVPSTVQVDDADAHAPRPENWPWAEEFRRLQNES